MKSLTHFLLWISLILLPAGHGPAAYYYAAASGGGAGNVALVASADAQGSPTGATTAAIDTTGANLIIIHGAWYDAVTPDIGRTDSAANTWTPLTAQSATGAIRSQLFYCYNPSTSATHTFSLSGTDVYASIQVLAFSGVAASPFDAQTGATTTSSSTLATGSITPGQANTVVVAGLCHEANSSGAVSIGSGFTVQEASAYVPGTCMGGAMAYKILTSATAQNPTWDITNSAAALAAVIASFKD